jgi:enamine deaminase RidA (YjgF/YER057c/UK114 family)
VSHPLLFNREGCVIDQSSTALLKMRHFGTRDSTQHCQLPADFTLRESYVNPDFLFEIEAIAFMMAATPVFMRL